MKKFLKNIGRIFITLNQIDKNSIQPSVLLVDGSFILPNNFALIIRGVKSKFKNAKIVVLTFKDREDLLKDIFPDVEVVVPSDKIGIRRYKLAIQLFLLLIQKTKYEFVVLSSLDISLLFISLIFSRYPLLLHNRWLEWYRLRPRTISDVLRGAKSIDKNRRRRNRGLRDIIKSLGRVFVILCNVKDEDVKLPVLVIDNGYTDIAHVSTAVRRVDEKFLNPDITVLTFPSRKHFFVDMFPQATIITVEPDKRCALAKQMYRLRKERFNYVILTTLDISPIIISFLSIRANVLLYNQWHEWWVLNFRDIRGYLKEALKFIIMIPVFVYLLIATALILLKTGLRLGLISQFKRRNKNEYEPI